MTRFYGIIHQELIEAFIQFSADKMLVTINNNKIHQRRICFVVMEMAHFHPGEFLVKKTLQFKKEEAPLHNDRMEAVSNGLVLLQ